MKTLLAIAASVLLYSPAWGQAFGNKVLPLPPKELVEPIPGLLCSEIEKVSRFLQREHHQRVVVEGVGSHGSTMMQVWASDGGFQWTIVAADPSGTACIVYRGTGLRIYDGLKANYRAP